jgi:hypothetical protein
VTLLALLAISSGTTYDDASSVFIPFLEIWYNEFAMHEQFRKAYLGFGLLAVVAWVGLALFVYNTHPEQFGVWSLVLLYLLLAAALFGLVTTIELALRRKFITAPFPVICKASVRQAVLCSVLVVSLLILQAEGLLFWWVAASLVLLFICIEGFLNL